MDNIFDKSVFMRHALDAVPSMVLVTDEDARILYRNLAARQLLSGEKVYGNRIGEIMHCIHAEDVQAGCGHGPHCSDCIIRNSVNSAFSGKAVSRERTDISVQLKDKVLVVPALISSSPFSLEGKLYSLLVIEDISELVELRALLTICSSCKKVLAEGGQWDSLQSYIKKHIPESNLSHGLCPDCAKRLYPKHSS